MHIHFIQHETFEAPGAYLDWAKSQNHTISFSKVYQQEPLPQVIDDIDLLIVMGGPQNPNTTKKDCPHFDALAEIKLIQKAIRAQKVVIGVCLGAQLIGEALGATYEHSPEQEIGAWPIQLTTAGLKDDNLVHFGTTSIVGHWHGDMPGLTPTSKVLATSAGCPRQIVAYSDKVYGFQCHLEFTPEVVDLLITEELDFLNQDSTPQFVQFPDEIRTVDYSEMNQHLFDFLDKLTVNLN